MVWLIYQELEMGVEKITWGEEEYRMSHFFYLTCSYGELAEADEQNTTTSDRCPERQSLS